MIVLPQWPPISKEPSGAGVSSGRSMPQPALASPELASCHWGKARAAMLPVQVSRLAGRETCGQGMAHAGGIVRECENMPAARGERLRFAFAEFDKKSA